MKNLARFFGMVPDKPEISNPAENSIIETVIEQQVIPDSINAHEVHYLKTSEIIPNPFQPRKTFHEEALNDLAASIREFGVIQPLLVRKTIEGYELIAGERRLRASRLAELAEVPVIIKDLADKEMAELAMIENLQREDLHYLEEAEGFQQLIANFGFTQEELARRMGKRQSTIANKLRLLKLSDKVRSILVQEQLTERHARALLKLDDAKLQLEVLDVIRQKELNVRETEALIQEVLDDISREMEKKAPRQNVVRIIRDVRIFLNTINNVVGEMKKTGLNVKVDQEQNDDYITVKLQIPKRK